VFIFSDFKKALESGDIDGLRLTLQQHADYADRKIIWGEQQKNQSDPLHYISDCVFSGRVKDNTAAAMAKVLLDHGASINGTDGAETPLIGSASLSAPLVSKVLINAGADIHAVSIFGANALHWAAYVGTPDVVRELIGAGANIETTCVEFTATPLFWAVQGYSKYGTTPKIDQVDCAARLIEAGANLHTQNIEGVSVLTRSKHSESDRMTQLLLSHGATLSA
jgi:uncharacterized protein